MIAAAPAGVIAGLIHVLSGPDHLAAVAPIASDDRRRPWRAGLSWGLGHSAGVLSVGLLALWLRERLPLESLSSWSERLVGLALIGVGLWGFRRVVGRRVHAHPHVHGPLTHDHLHLHARRAEPASPSHARSTHVHSHAAFGIGILHGLAGSSHFIGVMPALALPDAASALGYLAGYGAGTVAGMSAFAYGLGLVGARAARSGGSSPQWLLSACSAAAILVGFYWLGV